MKSRLVRSTMAIFSVLSASAATAHGLHSQTVVQGGILDDFLHLFVAHGYGLVFLLAGLGAVAVRTGFFRFRLQHKRVGGPRRQDRQGKH